MVFQQVHSETTASGLNFNINFFALKLSHHLEEEKFCKIWHHNHLAENYTRLWKEQEESSNEGDVQTADHEEK